MTFQRTHDLIRLARPFPDRYVHRSPGSQGADYVAHSVVTQKLILVLRSVPDFEVVEVIRGHVAGIDADPNGKSRRAKQGAPALENAIVGVIGRLSATVDGRFVRVEEAGDCEDPHNWPHDGARLKDAMSDAYKRCAMRMGVGLHLWAQEDFFLYDRLQAEASEGGEAEDSNPSTEGDRAGEQEPAARPSRAQRRPAPSPVDNFFEAKDVGAGMVSGESPEQGLDALHETPAPALSESREVELSDPHSYLDPKEQGWCEVCGYSEEFAAHVGQRQLA